MAQGTVGSLGLYQWGMETAAAPGTSVAATSMMAIERLGLKPKDVVSRPRLARGLAIASPGHEYIAMRGVDLDLPSQPAYFEQLQNWFNASIAQDDAPVGATPAVWTHTRKSCRPCDC